MKTVILCGGFGTRIINVAGEIPKPMIPIGPFPIIWHIMKYYSSYGHNDFVLCLGYKKQVIKEQLHKINWKKLDNLYKQILQVGRTKKISFPKSKKTKRRKSRK